MAGVSRFTGAARLTVWPRFELGGARRDPRIAVQFYGFFRDYISVANVCRQWVAVLAGRVPGFGFHDYAGNGSGPGPAYADYEAVNPDAPVAVYYGFPNHLPPEVRSAHRTLIGAYFCETDRIPNDWVERCNEHDLVIVPSRYCRDVFTECGVSAPIVVVPHGVEPEYKPAAPRQRHDPFVFYNTFAAESFAHRKGAEELVRSFLRAFDGRDDVVLRLRTEDSAVMQDLARRYDFGRLIRVEPPRPLDTAEFAALYHDADCTVHPSVAEGFGLIPFQSIACGTPVIAPAATGMADYLSDDNAMVLRTAGTQPGIGFAGQSGDFRAIDEDHLVELLRYAVDNWEAELAKVQRASTELRARYRWETVLDPLVELLNQTAKSKGSN